jgi:hypothetical protein
MATNTDARLLYALLASLVCATLLCAVLMLRRAAFYDDAYQLPMLIAVTLTVLFKLPEVAVKID